MKTFFKLNPIMSFVIITFLITFSLWFFTAVVSLPKDLNYAIVLLGGCGPLIAGYIITVVNSRAKIGIHSKSIFVGVLLITSSVLLLGFYFTNPNSSLPSKKPILSEISYLACAIYAFVVFIVSINFSNATNNKLKENYLKSAIYEKGKAKWYIIGFGLMVIIYLSSYAIGAAAGLETTDYIINFNSSWVVGFLFIFFFTGGNEEFGWRGFLQKELQKKYNPLVTSLIISFLWSLWHLPLHYNGFYSTGGIVDLLPRFIWTFPLTIIYTWLYNKSSYALLAVLLFHAMFNGSISLLGYSMQIAWALAFLFSVFCFVDNKMWKKQSFEHIYH